MTYHRRGRDDDVWQKWLTFEAKQQWFPWADNSNINAVAPEGSKKKKEKKTGEISANNTNIIEVSMELTGKA